MVMFCLVNPVLEEGFKFFEDMVYHSEILDIIACTSLIRGFCKRVKTRKATRFTEIIEDLRDVITYTMFISGYCRTWEIDNDLQVFDRISVAPDVVTYNTILCDGGKLKQMMELSDRQFCG
ncbi:hypothetical protein GQ457_07G004980 [Hibiscus cannabinus]